MNAKGTAHLRRRIYDLEMMLISALSGAEFLSTVRLVLVLSGVKAELRELV